jgi:alpha-1,4-galacturonosyltransferase
MKGHHSAPLSPAAAAAKRRCSGMAAAVPALVLCSVLLPLAFLLGLHRTGKSLPQLPTWFVSADLC